MNKSILILSMILMTLLPLVSSVNPVQAASLTISAPSQDAMIYLPDLNLGGSDRLDVGALFASTYDFHALVQFDLPPGLSGVTIISASLSLYYVAAWSGADPAGSLIRVCRVTTGWVEGTGLSGGGPHTQDGVTWIEYNYYDGLTTSANDWTTPGGDSTLTDSATATWPAVGGWVDWTVTDIVQGWSDGDYPNYGFLIRLDDESTVRGGTFSSRELYGGWAPAPRLEITYTEDIPVYVDIKPGSWPNPIKTRSRGVLPVCICGTEDFDVLTVDPATVRLHSEDVEAGVAPLRWSWEDVATPYTTDMGGGHDLGGDGLLDLVFHFDTPEATSVLTLTGNVGETLPLILRGNLFEEYDGTAIYGEDTVWIL